MLPLLLFRHKATLRYISSSLRPSPGLVRSCASSILPLLSNLCPIRSSPTKSATTHRLSVSKWRLVSNSCRGKHLFSVPNQLISSLPFLQQLGELLEFQSSSLISSHSSNAILLSLPSSAPTESLQLERFCTARSASPGGSERHSDFWIHSNSTHHCLVL